MVLLGLAHDRLGFKTLSLRIHELLTTRLGFVASIPKRRFAYEFLERFSILHPLRLNPKADILITAHNARRSGGIGRHAVFRAP